MVVRVDFPYEEGTPGFLLYTQDQNHPALVSVPSVEVSWSLSPLGVGGDERKRLGGVDVEVSHVGDEVLILWLLWRLVEGARSLHVSSCSTTYR